jgi:hypothetical protein
VVAGDLVLPVPGHHFLSEPAATLGTAQTRTDEQVVHLRDAVRADPMALRCTTNASETTCPPVHHGSLTVWVDAVSGVERAVVHSRVQRPRFIRSGTFGGCFTGLVRIHSGV